MYLEKRQRGVGLPAAIFVITVMAAIAVAINLLVAQNAETLGEELRLTRAYYAAESGAGFAMNTLFPPAGYPDYATGSCPAERSFDFTADGLNACSATVSCEQDYTDPADDVTYYTITSMGSCGDVSRTLLIRASR